MINKYAFSFAVFFAALIVGCDSGSGSSSSSNRDLVDISGVGSTHEIDRAARYDLRITGTNNTVTIKEHNRIGQLTIKATSAYITIEPHVSIDECTFGGMGTTINLPEGAPFPCTSSGTGNEIIRY